MSYFVLAFEDRAKRTEIIIISLYFFLCICYASLCLINTCFLMRFLKFSLLLWSILLPYCNVFALQQNTFNAATNVYYLKAGDGHEDITVSDEITFKCVASGSIPSFRDAGVCFSPGKAGDVIQISIEDIDLDGNSNYLLLYNGYAKTGYPMPDGWTNKLGKTFVGQTFLSQSADGKLTFGFHSSSSNSQKGWTIRVKSVTPTNMEYVSAGSSLGAAVVNRGGCNQVLLDINVETSGINNPQIISNFNFSTSIPANTIQSLKLYSGNELIGEITNYGTTFSIPASLALKSGTNHFQLKADILPDAVNGTILPVSLTGVTIGNEVKTGIPALTEYAKVSSDILIQSEPLTYTIGDSMNFYDDGGKAGKISANFNGTITFVPASSGKKIEIDFSKLEIFNTSSVGYNDIFNFYNGKTVDESKLNTTLLKEGEIVKSTSDDGALTITLKSTTGVPANGWEAIVSEFVPGDMSFTEVSSTASTKTIVAAGNTNEPLLIFNVKTNNTLNPLKLQSVKIESAGTSVQGNIKKAKVYYLGKTGNFSTTKLVGETNSLSGEFAIAGEQELAEGNNYFALTYDIAENSLNTNKVAAILKSITLSGTEQTMSNQQTSILTVTNAFKAESGTFNKTVYDEWVYTDQKSPYTPAYYNYENADCQVTFSPAADKAVAEIEFSAFDVYYSNSTAGTKAVFEVYSGNKPDAANLLWKLNDNAQSKVGPGKKLRSTATDGSLTVKFNANTTSAYYAGTGWNAKVRPFIDHKMVVDSIVAFQDNTSNIAPGSSNQEIVGFEITTNGTLNPLTLESVKLNLKNSLLSVSKVNVLYSGAEKNFTNAVPIAALSTPDANETNISASQLLPEGKSYFWISYDIKDEVENNQAIDAGVISIILNGQNLSVDKGDPNGQRLTKNEIQLASGNSGQLTLSKSRLFYDNGGADNSYNLSFDGQITFLPSQLGDVVKMKFNKFNTYFSHYMYIYAGKEVNADKLLAKVSGSNLPAQVLSNSEDGALTVRFVSTSSGSTNVGWEAEVSSYTPQAHFVETITTSQVGESTIMRGSEKAPIQRVVLKIGGDKGNVTINNLTFNKGTTTSLGNITRTMLYYTGKSGGFIANNLLGENNGSTEQISFDLSNLSLADAGEYNFWLACNVDKNTTAGNKIGVALSSITAGNTQISSIVTAKAVERTVKKGFSGNYVIGKSASADYSGFGAAIQAMKDGIEGPVTFKVEAGTYPETVLLKYIPGTSATNSIIFTSLSGNSDDVIISGSGYSEPAYGNTKYGMFCVDSTSYVTVENISFAPTDQAYPYNVHIRNVSRNFTMRNCKLTANLITSGYTGINQLYMEPLNIDGSNNDYATIEGNAITGGYIGLYMGGTSYVALTKETGAVIRNNHLVNQASKGIYLFDECNGVIAKNVISSTTTQKTDYQAIDIFRCKEATVVQNNKISISQAYYSKGINLRNETFGTVEKPALVYNNAISITNSPNSSTYGIAITDNCSNIQLYHNTVLLSGNGGYTFGVTGTNETMKNMVFQNNLLQNKTTSNIYFFNKESQLKAFSFKNNAYLLTGTSFSNKWGADLNAWITTANELNGIAETAGFVSETDLHLTAAGRLNSALPVDFITLDADDKTRSTITPTIGAYEYEAIVEATPEMEIGYPKIKNITHNSADLTVKYNQSGKFYQLIQKSDAEVPTVAKLLEQTPQNINKAEELTTKVTALNQVTSYKAYCVMVSALNKESIVTATDVFTTIKQVLPLSVILPGEWGRIESGTHVTLYPQVTGGVYPYHYSWKNDLNETISTDSILTIQPSVLSHYTLTVVDANLKDSTLSTVIYVNGDQKVADFENLYLANDNYWQGPAGNTADNMESKFYSGSYSFSNTYYPDWNYWGGYAYSNQTSTSFDPANSLTQQFRSVVGHGAQNSTNYAIVYTMGARTDINITNNTSGDVIPGVYLTNAAYTYSSIINGDSFVGAPFGEGDWYKIKFTGTKTDGSTTEKEIYLADYRSANVAERFVVTDWKWYNLSSLGAVTKVSISIDSSRKNNFGLTIPAYFCMDSFGATDAATGIHDNQIMSAGEIKVYPNPFTEYIIVKSDRNQTMKLFNISGQCLINTNITSGENRIDVQSLSKGTYIVQCGNKTVKIVK